MLSHILHVSLSYDEMRIPELFLASYDPSPYSLFCSVRLPFGLCIRHVMFVAFHLQSFKFSPGPPLPLLPPVIVRTKAAPAFHFIVAGSLVVLATSSSLFSGIFREAWFFSPAFLQRCSSLRSPPPPFYSRAGNCAGYACELHPPSLFFSFLRRLCSPLAIGPIVGY